MHVTVADYGIIRDEPRASSGPDISAGNYRRSGRVDALLAIFDDDKRHHHRAILGELDDGTSRTEAEMLLGP